VANAAHCGQGAPGIAHLWHMSGHTFSELRRYTDAAWQQEASARVDHAYMNAARVMPEQIHNYAHNNDWLVQDLVYVGRIHDAVDLAKNLIELPRLGPGKQQPGAWDAIGSSTRGELRNVEGADVAGVDYLSRS
jgi:hypothetical protein